MTSYYRKFSTVKKIITTRFTLLIFRFNIRIIIPFKVLSDFFKIYCVIFNKVVGWLFVCVYFHGTKGIEQWLITWCTSPMLIHNKRLDTQLNKPTYQNLLKVPKVVGQRISKRYYKTLGTCVINAHCHLSLSLYGFYFSSQGANDAVTWS